MIKQRIYLEWLSKKTQGSSRGCFFVQMLVSQSRYKDHWSHNALFAQLVKQVKSTHSRHVYVGYDALQTKSV